MADKRDERPCVLLFLATFRGLRALKVIQRLELPHRFVVVTFDANPEEPQFTQPIESQAAKAGYEFRKGKFLRNAEWTQFFKENSIEMIFCLSWRFMLPPHLVAAAQKGAFLIHDSLLPRYRGFAPTVWAMLNSERQLGASLITMAEDVDAGDIIRQRTIDVQHNEGIASVMERLTIEYEMLLREYFPLLLTGDYTATPQDHSKATFTCKLCPEDYQIDFSKSSDYILNFIRTLARPYPGSFTHLKDRKIRVWAAEAVDPPLVFEGFVPGRVARFDDRGSCVVCGDGLAIRIMSVQWDDEVDKATEIGDDMSGGPFPAQLVLNQASITLRWRSP